ncbi:uncharacterized protein LOC144689171 [Cetorhinus maximus]
MEECNDSSLGTGVPARKEPIPTTLLPPDQISVIEESMAKSPPAVVGESEVASLCPVDGIPPGGVPKILLIDVDASESQQEEAEVEEFESIVQQGDMLKGNHDADDFKMPQLLEVVDEETLLYPGWHKCGSWQVINTTAPAISTNQNDTTHDHIGPSLMAENKMQPEPNSIAIVAESTDAMKTSNCENKMPSPVMQALGFCLSVLALMTILHYLWDKIEYMACTWKG